MFDWFLNTPLDWCSVEKTALKYFGNYSAFELNMSISLYSVRMWEKIEKKIVAPSVLYGCGYLLLL